MSCKLSSVILACVVVATVTVQSGMSQPAADDSFNYWSSQRVWQALGKSDVFTVTGGSAPTGGKIAVQEWDTIYSKRAGYVLLYKETSIGAGYAFIITSSAFSTWELSYSSLGFSFGINLPQPAVLHFVYRSVGNAGSASTIPGDQVIPAGPPSNHVFQLYSNSPWSDGGLHGTSSVSLVWGPVGQLPGQAVTNPLPVGKAIPPATILEDEIAADPAMVAGVGYLTTVPVDGDFGYTEPIYFGDPPANSPAPLDRAARGYGYVSQGLNIASVVLPGALPNGDSQFELLVGETYYPVNAGSVFDFTSLVPGGVESFALMGIDPAEGLDPTAAPPFPVGLQFAAGGQTQLYTLTYAPILPGDFNKDGAVDAADYVLWRKGTNTQADYDLWRANFGETIGIGAVASAIDSIPEPTSVLLVSIAVVMLGGNRLRTRRGY